MSVKKLSPEEIETHLAGPPLEAWKLNAGKLHREYEFPDFVHAFGFMATAAIAIEAMNHHPDWSNVYNRVVVDLVTHDSGGITAKDIELARLLESLAAKLK
jgi:4a-hydroxytetrahydrobiopterin dehydratase